MGDFLWTQFCHHPEVEPHITFYLFEHRNPWVEVLALKQRVEAKAKNLSQMENTCKELRSRVDSLTAKGNRLRKK